MQDKQHTQDILSLVKNYTLVPGLVLATIGGFMVFLGAFNMLWSWWLYYVLFGKDQNTWLETPTITAVFILPVALYTIVLLAVVRYYKRHFGMVKPRAEVTRRLVIELTGAFVAYFFIGGALDTYLRLPVSMMLLIFALFLLVHWWLFVRTQVHYLLLAAIAVVLSIIPLFSNAIYFWLYIQHPSPDWYGFNISVCAGLLLLLAGLLDHWFMTRRFAQIRSFVLASSLGEESQQA